MNVNTSCHDNVCHALFNSLQFYQFYSVNIIFRYLVLSVRPSTHKKPFYEQEANKNDRSDEENTKDCTLIVNTGNSFRSLFLFFRSFYCMFLNLFLNLITLII